MTTHLHYLCWVFTLLHSQRSCLRLSAREFVSWNLRDEMISLISHARNFVHKPLQARLLVTFLLSAISSLS